MYLKSIAKFGFRSVGNHKADPAPGPKKLKKVSECALIRILYTVVSTHKCGYPTCTTAVGAASPFLVAAWRGLHWRSRLAQFRLRK